MNEDNSLIGVVIDPGHGGTDSGAIGNDLYEKNYNLEISKYMYNRFKELGIPVYITRNEDTTLSPTERINEIIEAFGNNPNVVVISNHLNAGGGTGAEVIYALRNPANLSNKILTELSKNGLTPRKTYQRTLPSDNTKDYYFIHRNTGVTEPVIIEYGFIDDTSANVNYLKDNYQSLAEAVIKSVLDYKNIPYTKPQFQATNTYIVTKGDTLYSLSKKFNTTVDELKTLNNLTSNLLSIGQILLLPTTTTAPTNKLYTVEKGNTLYSIAKNYNTSVDALKELNNLTSNILTVGSTILIPSSNYSLTNYIVTKGDTLYSLSKKYNISVDELKNLNNLTSNLLSVGQILKVPTLNDLTYTVAKGDTLYSIANNHNTTVDNLKNLNNLSTNNLSIGQILILK